MTDLVERMGKKEDAFQDRLVGEGARKGSTAFGRAGDVFGARRLGRASPPS